MLFEVEGGEEGTRMVVFRRSAPCWAVVLVAAVCFVVGAVLATIIMIRI